jgi:hypothetical protein
VAPRYHGLTALVAWPIAGARAAADRAIERSAAHGERGHEAMAWRLIGDIAARSTVSDFSSAREAYEQAIAIGDELGRRPLVARTHFNLGQPQRRLGDSAVRTRDLAVVIPQ